MSIFLFYILYIHLNILLQKQPLIPKHKIIILTLIKNSRESDLSFTESGKYNFASGIFKSLFIKYSFVNKFGLVKYGKEKPPTFPKGINYKSYVI